MRNPTRRNRNIGLGQGGRVKSGRPEEKLSRRFSRDVWQDLSALTGGCRVLVENPSRNFFHPCDPSEYQELLARLPADITKDLRAIVLRRTSRRDQLLDIEARRRFSCVILNSFPRSLDTPWPRRPTDGEVHHFTRWCTRWHERDGRWILSWTLDEVRRYYLFHLFLHELGHINQPWTYSARRREAFAENFALEWAGRLGATSTQLNEHCGEPEGRIDVEGK